MNKIRILSAEIDNIDWAECLDFIQRKIKEKKPCYIVTPNVDHLVKLENDSEFRDVYYKASLVLADGVPVLWAARFLGTPLQKKISGSDLFLKLCDKAIEGGYKFFFLGGRPGAALKAAEKLKGKHPGMQIAGTYCPPFGFENNEEENNKIVKIVKDANPDILFVGLGAPKQEKWIAKYYNECLVPVSIGIGVSFEFVAGVVRRAPLWMQKAGLEWFWRLMSEPKRLWRRYLVDDMKFFWLVFRQKFS